MNSKFAEQGSEGNEGELGAADAMAGAKRKRGVGGDLRIWRTASHDDPLSKCGCQNTQHCLPFPLEVDVCYAIDSDSSISLIAG